MIQSRDSEDFSPLVEQSQYSYSRRQLLLSGSGGGGVELTEIARSAGCIIDKVGFPIPIYGQSHIYRRPFNFPTF